MLIEETCIEKIPLWIENYNELTITVDGLDYQLPILMTDQNITVVNYLFAELSLEQILALLSVANSRPEIIIFGTGKQRQLLTAKIELALFRQGIAIEMMSTSSACRTINILKAEGRNVWAFLWLS